MKMWRKYTSILLVICMLLSVLAGCGSQQAEKSTASENSDAAPVLNVTSDILGMADTGNKTTLKVDLIKTSGPGDINLYYYNEAGERVIYENQDEICVPLDPVTYTGSAVLDLGDVDDSKIDSSNAVVKIADGSGYYADEYILNATTLDGAWVDGKYTYTLSQGDIEFNTWGYDTTVDYNSGREWSIMGGDGNGVYAINLEVSGITYDGIEIPPAQFRVNIYCYGRSCTDLSLSTEFVPNTYDTSYNSGMAAGDKVKWVWSSDNLNAVKDDKPYMNDMYTDYFSIVWPEGVDGSNVTADNITVTLSSLYGEEYVLSAKTAYGEEEYAVFASGNETVVAVTYQQWTLAPVYNTLTIEAVNGDMVVSESFDICSVGVNMVQTGGGGVTVDHTVTCYNFYGVTGMTEENATNTSYTLSTVVDDVTYYYAEDASGNAYLTTDPDEAWIGDCAEYYNVSVRGNVVFVETRDVTTEDRTVDGVVYTFTQNTPRNMYVAASEMVENGASLLPGYNLSNTTKWAWTMRYQAGWTTGSAKPEGLPYVEGCYPYGYEAGSDDPVYLEELANAGASNNFGGNGPSGVADGGPGFSGPNDNGPGGDGPNGNGPDGAGPDSKKEYDIDVKAGTYTFKEVNFSNLEITWTLELQEDGTYTLTEENFLVGRLNYPGESWTVVDGVVICGKMDPGPEHFDWANPAGFSVRISGETFEPVTE